MACTETWADLIASPLRLHKGTVTLNVRVTPKSARDEISGLHTAADGAVSIAVKVSAPPDKGKANKAVFAVLAKAFNLPKSAFAIVSGETSRHKVVSVAGNLAELEAVIASYRNLI